MDETSKKALKCMGKQTAHAFGDLVAWAMDQLDLVWETKIFWGPWFLGSAIFVYFLWPTIGMGPQTPSYAFGLILCFACWVVLWPAFFLWYCMTYVAIKEKEECKKE